MSMCEVSLQLQAFLTSARGGWRRVVSDTYQPLHSQGRSRRYPLAKGLYDPCGRSRRDGEGVRPVTIPTPLSRTVVYYGYEFSIRIFSRNVVLKCGRESKSTGVSLNVFQFTTLSVALLRFLCCCNQVTLINYYNLTLIHSLYKLSVKARKYTVKVSKCTFDALSSLIKTISGE